MAHPISAHVSQQTRKGTQEDVAERGTLVIVRHGNPAQATYILGVYAGRDKTTNPKRHVVEGLDVIAGNFMVTHDIVGADDIIVKDATQEQFGRLRALRAAQEGEVKALTAQHVAAVEQLLNPPPTGPLTPQDVAKKLIETVDDALSEYGYKDVSSAPGDQYLDMQEIFSWLRELEPEGVSLALYELRDARGVGDLIAGAIAEAIADEEPDWAEQLVGALEGDDDTAWLTNILSGNV